MKQGLFFFSRLWLCSAQQVMKRLELFDKVYVSCGIDSVVRRDLRCFRILGSPSLVVLIAAVVLPGEQPLLVGRKIISYELKESQKSGFMGLLNLPTKKPGVKSGKKTFLVMFMSVMFVMGIVWTSSSRMQCGIVL